MTLRKDVAFVFPGQGSQTLGMMSDFAEIPSVLDLYAKASNRLGFDLWQLTQEGPESTLNQTQYTQPALLVASFALWQLWQDQTDVQPAWLAGHSLGEYSALVAAQAIEFEDAVELVHARGLYMQEAVAQGQGAMAAILGLDEETISTACHDAAQGQVVQAANLNAPGQTVIAGDKDAVERAVALLKEMGAKRSLILPVSVPSHCELMRPAAERLQAKLADITIQSPRYQILHNCDTQSRENPEQIRQALVEQLFRPVQWVSTIERLSQRPVDHCVECGPGKVLSGLIKRINKDLNLYAIGQLKEFNSCKQRLATQR